MKNKELISVIVPCYKVEKWLPACLDSILMQTHENLEIICVDDGSPDRSGEILEEYAKKNGCIQVIHQENRGLSGARNTALDIATGEYVAFLDSDDLAAPEWLEAMLTSLKETKSDLAICGFRLYFEGSSRFEPAPLKGIDHPVVYPPREALCRLIAEKPYKELVWNKLYRRSLWDGIRFPEGRNFEDVAVMYRIFSRVRGVVVLPGTFIDYRQHSGSIIGSRRIKNELDGIANYIERYRALSGNDASLSPLLLRSFVRRPLRHLALTGLWNTASAHRQEAARRSELAAFLKENRAAILPLCTGPDRAIVKLFSADTVCCSYLAGVIAFFLRLLEKAGLREEAFITDNELTEAVYGR